MKHSEELEAQIDHTPHDDFDRGWNAAMRHAIKKARALEAENARLQAIEAAARELTTTGFFWWSDGDDDRITYRCLGCDVDRDDIQSGVDKHHPSCRVGKLAAALTQPGDGGEG
jgi:hypothetical protein